MGLWFLFGQFGKGLTHAHPVPLAVLPGLGPEGMLTGFLLWSLRIWSRTTRLLCLEPLAMQFRVAFCHCADYLGAFAPIGFLVLIHQGDEIAALGIGLGLGG